MLRHATGLGLITGALVGCVRGSVPITSDDTTGDSTEWTDSVVPTETGGQGESGDSTESHDTSRTCDLADITGRNPIRLTNGLDTAVFYHPTDTPLAPDGFPTVVVLQGSDTAGGVPFTGDPTVDTFGYIQVVVSYPDDRRGADSRAAIATVARYAAGLEADADGCYLSDRVSVTVSKLPSIIQGQSNGGNTLIATLADNSLDLPPLSGAVMWEVPIEPEMVTVEMGGKDFPNPFYMVGQCQWPTDGSLTCPYTYAPRLGWDPTYAGAASLVGAVYFDLDNDGALGDADYPVLGAPTVDGHRAFSLQLRALMEEQGLVGPDAISVDDNTAFWAERDGSLLAKTAAANFPDLPMISIGTETDHGMAIPDHPHVSGVAGAWQDLGEPWVRVNPAPSYMTTALGSGPAWTDNPPNSHTYPGDPAIVMEPEETELHLNAEVYRSAAVLELIDRTLSGDWETDDPGAS